MFRVGDIVDMAFTNMAFKGCPDQRGGVMLVLRALTLLDSSFSKVMHFYNLGIVY